MQKLQIDKEAKGIYYQELFNLNLQSAIQVHSTKVK